MKKIATFSNGHTDEYKGRRDVKAAWMLILPCGRILSGHSLDKEKAYKTAKSQPVMSSAAYLPGPAQYRDARCRAYFTGIAKKQGFDSLDAYIADGKKKRAEFQAKCKIEVIEI